MMACSFNGWMACVALHGPLMGLAALAFAALAIGVILWRHRKGRRGDPHAMGRDPQRRRWLFSLALAPWTVASAQLPPQSQYHTQPRPRGAPAREVEPPPTPAPPRPAGSLAVVRLINTGDAPQAAGCVSPMFGQPFRQGDVPAGSYPQFVLPDGQACPATLWGITSWPDGSMKFCAAMVRVPVAIAAGGSLQMAVRSGGARPAPSKRATVDLTAADLKVELTGVTALDGRWTASLNDGVRDASDLVLIGNGPAGAIWRIGSDLRDGSGAAHGQLYCWHYVAALNGPDDQLLGLRYLGRVAQPWADVASPPAQHREFSAVLKSGGTQIRALQGHNRAEVPPGATIRLPHFASFFTAGPLARWDYVQGAGSASQDCSVRIAVDAEYFVQSRLVPPYDLKVRVGPARPASYYPMGNGTTVPYMGTSGERPDIGLMPDWNVRHLIEPSTSNETVARVNGLAASGWRLGFRQRASRQPIVCVDIKPGYSGMGPIRTGWRGYSHMTGIALPGPNESTWAEDAAHRPGSVYWPYLFSGEPQYLDLLIEQACTHVLDLNPGNDTVWSTNPQRKDVWDGSWGGERGLRIGRGGTLYKGSGVLLDGTGGMRVSAWRSRDVAQAAALTPDQPPDGAAVREYLRDVMNSCYAGFADYAAKMPASFRDAGLFIQNPQNGTPWQAGYLSWSLCHQADILGTPQAAFVRRYLSRFWSSFASKADIGCLVTAVCTYQEADGRLIQSIEGVLGYLQCTLTFDAASSRIRVSANRWNGSGAWSPHDGDVFAFIGKDKPAAPMAEALHYRRLHAVNCRGQTFQLALQPGGAPLPVLADGVVTECMARLKDFSPDFSFDAVSGPHGYPANIRGAVAYHQACGDDVAAAKRGLDAIVDGLRVDFTDQPKWAAVGQRS